MPKEAIPELTAAAIKRARTMGDGSVREDEALSMPITAVEFDPRNARVRTERSSRMIRESLQQFGPLRSLVGQRLSDGRIIVRAGNGTLEEAGQIGIDKVRIVERKPDELIVVVADDLDEDQWKQYAIADNRSSDLSEWDIEVLQEIAEEVDLTDWFLPDEMDGWGLDAKHLDSIERLTDENDVPAPEDVETRCKRGDIWQLGKHRIMCGDSTVLTDVERLMDGNKIDMVFADPPYGVSYASKNEFLNNHDKGNRVQTPIENDHLNLEQTGRLWADTFSIWSSFLSDYSSYYIASPQGGDLFLMMMMMMNENGFPLRHCLIWAKNNHVLGRCDYNYKHEPILFGWAKKHRFYGNGSMKTSVWDVAKPLKNDLHPTMKPVELIENAILNSTLHKELVADMFLGSGSTLIACEKTGRVCYGMELSEKYSDTILKRWEDYTGRTAELVQ